MGSHGIFADGSDGLSSISKSLIDGWNIGGKWNWCFELGSKRFDDASVVVWLRSNGSLGW